MTTTKMNSAPTQLVAFNNTYVLTAIFKSISEASSVTGLLRQSLVKAAYGDIISVRGKYWRAVPPDFEIEPGDIDKLTIFDFDSAVGEDRKIYGTKKMLRSSVMLESEYLRTINKQ